MLLPAVLPKLLVLRRLLLVLGVEATLVGVKASAGVGEVVSPQLMFVDVCFSGDALLSAELRYRIKWQTVASSVGFSCCCSTPFPVAHVVICMLTQGPY